MVEVKKRVDRVLPKNALLIIYSAVEALDTGYYITGGILKLHVILIA